MMFVLIWFVVDLICRSEMVFMCLESITLNMMIIYFFGRRNVAMVDKWLAMVVEGFIVLMLFVDAMQYAYPLGGV